MDNCRLIINLMLLFTTVFVTEATTPKLNEYEDNIAQESVHQPKIVQKPILNSAMPNSIFNNGKPFYGEKDPVSGQINFNSKKSSGQFTDELLVNDQASDFSGVPSNDISQIPSNFHDYLHLPVKYTSSKFVQPLVSSSYSNLKYQGNNKNFTSNHKNYTTTTERPTTNSANLSGFKQNGQTSVPYGGSSYYTLKPRPITNSPLQVYTTKTPSKTTNYYEYFKGKVTMKQVPVTEPTTPTTTTVKATTTTTTATTTTTPKPTTTKTTTTTTTQASTKPSTGTPIVFPSVASSEFKPSPAHPPTTPIIPSTPKPTKRPLTLSDILNSLESDKLNAIDGGKTEIKEITVSIPSQPNTASNGFTIPKLPQVPNRFDTNQNKPQQQQQPFVNHQPGPQLGHQTSSMNNIIIKPDQDSASFVLGSHQSFGETTDGPYIGSPSHNNPVILHEKPQFQFGTVISEDHLSEFKPQGFTSKEETKQENKVASSIRFPTENSQFDNSQIVTGSMKHELNIPTLSLPQSQIVVFPPNEKMPTEIVNSELSLNVKNPEENRVVFKNEKDILSMHSQPTYHQLPEGLTPPLPDNVNGYQQYNFNRMPPPPPQFALNMLNKKPAGNRIPDRSLPNILPQFRPNTRIDHQSYHQFMKKPLQNLQSPPFKQNMPPQFMHHERLALTRNPEKPMINNRIIQGINPNGFTNKMALMPDSIESNRRVYRIPPPMYEPPANRLYGPPIPQLPPNRYMQERPKMPLPSPHMGPMPQFNHKSQYEPKYPPPMPQQHHQVTPFESDDFYQRPPVIRHPAYTPPTAEIQNVQNHAEQSQPQPQPKMEPVVTLQMIQSKKHHQHQQLPNLSVDTRGPTHSQQLNANPSLNEINNGPGKNPVYVVYPIKSAPMQLNVISSDGEDSVVIGQRGDQPPLPPSEINGYVPKNDYQNTPFTIVRNEQQPILMAKDKSNQKLRVQFPYNLEKPDPLTVAELDRQSHIKKGQLNDFEVFNTGEAPLDALPKVINKGKPEDVLADDFEDETDDYLFGKGTRRPIAIAYTPTEPPTYYANSDRFSNPNYDGPVISEILDDDNDDDKYPAYNKDDIDELGYPSRGDNYEADFQAPFYPSVSLGGSVVKNDYEGWSVIVPSTTLPTISYASPSPATTTQQNGHHAQAQAQTQQNGHQAQHQKNQINRADHNSESDDMKTEVTTKKFDPNSFNPQFESGFKPIIGSPALRTPNEQNHNHGISTTTSPTTMKSNGLEQKTTTEQPSTISTSLKQVVTPNIKGNHTDSTDTVSTSSTDGSTKPEVATKKSVFESSIEALFGLSDDDYDENTARNL